ncbi:hypothetical protein NLI96_g5241 [Meripilus lineatus]|uniref:Tetratricopeptide repeat protein n=1 Tax=Meripilus lineatus TaxID=2056292 RepID=A0AAD5V5A1_9APHY|nr:hypothetical protein NLI96_g5241 [Physisporinus lineatus]
MNKRVGGEAIMGLGGGKVSAESTRNLEIAEDLCRKGRPYEAVPYLQKALEDTRNLDAPIQLAFLAPNFKESIRILGDAKKLGEVFLRADLGEKCLDDDGDRVGHYWSLIETRPYMRVLQALVRFYVEDGRFDQAANTSIEMLRLNPGDNQGQRTWTGPLLLKANRPADALSFLQHWLEPAAREGKIVPRGGCDFEAPSKEPLSAGVIESLGKHVEGTFVYTAALAAFKLWGPCELAEQYLTIATELNPAVLLKVLGKIARPSLYLAVAIPVLEQRR